MIRKLQGLIELILIMYLLFLSSIPLTPRFECHIIWLLREAVKYYFADFVRNGGTPPFTDNNFGKEGITDLGGTPHPLRHFPDIFTSKGQKSVFFAQKAPDFGPKNRLRIWGVPPSPHLRTKSAK